MENKYYIKIYIDISPEFSDLCSNYCFENNACGIEIINEQDYTHRLCVYFNLETMNEIEIKKKIIENFLQPYGIRRVSYEVCLNKDWTIEWKKHFKPILIAEKFVVFPPWKKPEIDEGQIPIIINPGSGFGTGSHESTALAIEVLEYCLQNINKNSLTMLDVGTGSGILSIAAGKLRIKTIFSIDIDIDAVKNGVENRKLNNLEGVIHYIAGSPLSIKGNFSIVICNMLFKEINDIKYDLVRLVKKNGILIISGFLENNWQTLKEFFLSYKMEILYKSKKGKWIAACFIQKTKIKKINNSKRNWFKYILSKNYS